MKTKINAIVDKAVFADGRYKGNEYVKEEVEVMKVECENYTAYIDIDMNKYVSTLVFMEYIASEIENRIESAKDWEIMHSNSWEEPVEDEDEDEEYVKYIFARCNKCFSYPFEYSFDGKKVNIINNSYKEEFIRIDTFSAVWEPEFDCAEEELAGNISHGLSQRFGYFLSENFETIFNNAE